MQDVRTIYIYQINIFVCCEWNTLHVDDEVYERIVVEIYWIRVICLWKPSGQIATPVQTKYNWIKYLILPFPTYNKHFTNLLHTSGYIQRWNSTPAASSRSYNLWRTTEKCIIHSSKQARQFQSQILSFVADEIRVCKAENYGPHFDRSHFIFLFVFVRLYVVVFFCFFADSTSVCGNVLIVCTIFGCTFIWAAVFSVTFASWTHGRPRSKKENNIKGGRITFVERKLLNSETYAFAFKLF